MKRSPLLLLILAAAALAAGAQTARKTVTNADLEKFRERRVQAEADYRANYEKRGMPSPEELEKREAERRAWHEDFARNRRAQSQQTAEFYQAQAAQIRSQLAGVQGQINYLRGLIGNTPAQQPYVVTVDQLPYITSFGTVGGRAIRGRHGAGAGVRGGGRVGGGGQFNRGRVTYQGPNVAAAQYNAGAAPNPYAGTPLARAGVKVVTGPQNLNRGRHNRPFFPFFYGGYPYAVNPNAGRDELVAQLQYLEQVRAGLLAQLSQLQDEARRAGVKID